MSLRSFTSMNAGVPSEVTLKKKNLIEYRHTYKFNKLLTTRKE